MGINIAGIAIDNNFNKELINLGEALEWEIEKIKPVQFSDALSLFSSKDEDIICVYFTESGTLILTPYKLAFNKFHPDGCNSLSFIYSENSMNFLFSYQDENSTYREFLEEEGVKKSAIGKPLSIEEEYPNASGLISKTIENLIGKNIHAVEHSSLIYQCRKLSHKEYMRRSEERLQKEMEMRKINDDKRIEKYMKEIGLDPKVVEKKIIKKKKWWEIWK